jgi:hypothetical protein
MISFPLTTEYKQLLAALSFLGLPSKKTVSPKRFSFLQNDCAWTDIAITPNRSKILNFSLLIFVNNVAI